MLQGYWLITICFCTDSETGIAASVIPWRHFDETCSALCKVMLSFSNLDLHLQTSHFLKFVDALLTIRPVMAKPIDGGLIYPGRFFQIPCIYLDSLRKSRVHWLAIGAKRGKSNFPNPFLNGCFSLRIWTFPEEPNNCIDYQRPWSLQISSMDCSRLMSIGVDASKYGTVCGALVSYMVLISPLEKLYLAGSKLLSAIQNAGSW